MPSRVYSLDGLERTRLTSAACMPACAGLVVDPLPPPHEDDARLSSARRIRQGAGSRSAESGSGGDRAEPARPRDGRSERPPPLPLSAERLPAPWRSRRALLRRASSSCGGGRGSTTRPAHAGMHAAEVSRVLSNPSREYTLDGMRSRQTSRSTIRSTPISATTWMSPPSARTYLRTVETRWSRRPSMRDSCGWVIAALRATSPWVFRTYSRSCWRFIPPSASSLFERRSPAAVAVVRLLSLFIFAAITCVDEGSARRESCTTISRAERYTSTPFVPTLRVHASCPRGDERRAAASPRSSARSGAEAAENPVEVAAQGLDQVVVEPRLARPADVLVASPASDGHHQRADRDGERADPAAGLEAVHVREREVAEHHVGTDLLHEVDAVQAGAGRPETRPPPPEAR